MRDISSPKRAFLLGNFYKTAVSRSTPGISNLFESLRIDLNKKSLLNRKLIFSINSGRSGSNYLAELLGTAENVQSHHENLPYMSGKYTDMVNGAFYQKSFDDRKVKNESIKRELINLPRDRIYCETNHMFIKTFHDVILSEFNNVKVLILRRKLSRVLKSFVELGYFSDKNPYALNWMTSPNAETAAIKPVDDSEKLDQIDRCIAYLIDIEARTVRFQKDYPQVDCYAVRLEDLNNVEYVREMFNRIGVNPTTKTTELVGEAVNSKNHKKKAVANSVDVEYCQHRIEKYIKRSQALNIAVPNSLALDDVLA